ncbi:MAG: sensor histidine kinase [Clostridia bacterium]|nr:sensor histidine kinase [Clostridia bacterium]
MGKASIRNRVKNAWEYKRTAFLWTVLSVLVFAVMCALFGQFSDAYFTSGHFTDLLVDAGNADGLIYMVLDDYVLMSFLLLMFALCCFTFLSQMWTDDVSDYYILLLLWSLGFYILYGLNLFNPGGGSLNYLVRVLSDTLYQLSTVPLLLCLYTKTERYRGFLRSVLVIEYVLCAIFALLSVTGLFPQVFSYVRLVSDLLFCGMLVGVLIIGFKEAKLGNGFFRWFCPLMAVELIAMGAVTLIAMVSDGGGLYMQRRVFDEIVQNFNLTPLREYYLQRMVLINLMLILFIRFITETMHNKTLIRVLNYEKESAQGYAAAVRERIDEVRRVKHDTMHHINACHMLYNQGEYDRLGEYLRELQTDGQAIAPLQYSNNLMIDYIVMSFSKKAEAKQISMQTDLAVLPELEISDSDLCSLLNNILQNAFDACLRLSDAEKRWVRLEVSVDENKVYFTCMNSCDGYFIRDNGRYLTTKGDGTAHGYGMSIIRGLCRRNGGAMASQVNGNSFTMKVALPYHTDNERGIRHDIQKEDQ